MGKDKKKKRETFTDEEIEVMKEKLLSLPPQPPKKQKNSKRETIDKLFKEISILQKRGYSLEQIADSLKGIGFTIATPTLQSYLQGVKRKRVRKKVVKIRKLSSEDSSEEPGEQEVERIVIKEKRRLGAGEFEVRANIDEL